MHDIGGLCLKRVQLLWMSFTYLSDLLLLFASYGAWSAGWASLALVSRVGRCT